MNAHVLSCFRMIWCLSLIEDWPCVLLIFLWCNIMSQFTQAERNRNYYNSTLESDLNLWPNVGCIAEELAVTIFKHLEIEDFLLTLPYLLMNAIDSEDVCFFSLFEEELTGKSVWNVWIHCIHKNNFDDDEVAQQRLQDSVVIWSPIISPIFIQWLFFEFSQPLLFFFFNSDRLYDY